MLHDCKRENDNADERHGARVASWLERNQDVLQDEVKSLLLEIAFAIRVHNDSYDRICGMPSYKKHKLFVDVLKAADVLDRYRFPRSDWWFSRHFVRLYPSVQDMAFAFDLALESEDKYLKTRNNFESIAAAWRFISLHKTIE